MQKRYLTAGFARFMTLAGLIVSLAAAARPARAQTVHATSDTNINLASPGQVNGTAASLFVRNSGSGGERHTYLQFDLSTVPSGVLINQAMLRIWVLAVNDPGTVDVFALDGPWNEETLSASMAPPQGALIGTFPLGVADQNRFALADITPVVQGWLNGSTPNYGIALVPSGSDPIRVTLDSKEATGTSHGPELEVAVIPTGDITSVGAGLGLTGGGAVDVVTLGLDTSFTDARYAPIVHEHNVSQVTNAARLIANTFTATQTIDAGNLDLDISTATAGNITKNGAAFVHNFGTDNTFLGAGTGNFTMTGLGRNTALGHAAFVSNTTGQQNTVVGYGALAFNTGGSSNIALGESVLRFNTTGGGNVAVGTSAMQFNTTGTHNTASGHVALRANTSGSFNTALGMDALEVNTTGASNTAVGRSALGISNGNNNVALGSGAGASATSGSFNIYLGADVFGAAGESNTMYLGKIGTQTTTYIAGVRGTTVTGGEVVVIDATGRLGTGAVAPGGDTVGATQVIDESLTASDLGPNSVSTSELTSGSVTVDKVAFNYAGSASPGGAATDVACLGCVAASEVGFSFASLGANAFSGTQAIDGGNLDLDASTATTGNITKNGTRFLHGFGAQNIFMGPSAGNFFLTGAGNTAAGYSALSGLGSGSNNTAVGAASLQATTGGPGNTAVGYTSLQSNTTGSGNTAVGASALNLHTTGIYNVAVGSQAGFNATTGSNNIYLGAFVLGVAGESNTMYLGKVGTQSKTLIAGVRGVTTVNPDAIPVMIDSAGQLGTVSSSRRFKEDIRDMGSASQRLLQLRPVTFSYTQRYGDGSKPVHYGLIAEEVAEVFPELAVRGADGQIETVQYQTLSVLLLNEFQRLQHEAVRQEDGLRDHQRAMQRQQERIELLERRLNDLIGKGGAPVKAKKGNR